MEPKVNEVWRTKSGRLALIVESHRLMKNGRTDTELAMLWLDEISNTWTVSEIEGRLVVRESWSLAGFFTYASTF